MKNSFGSRSTMDMAGQTYEIYRLDALQEIGEVSSLPYALKILLENLLRCEDQDSVKQKDIEALARWDAGDAAQSEIAFTPARVLMQDFTGVPAVVDLAAMRDAMEQLGGDPDRINPIAPAELVIDHSVQVDVYARPDAPQRNAAIEFDRNQERYSFLRWGQQAFSNLKVVPPDTGIVHQVNLEYLARAVFTRKHNGVIQAYPDTLVGTDSHTTMINGLGVLGWGVGGIEAEAAMLGQPISMLIPQVVGFELRGRLSEGVTATDLVLTVTQMLREKGVVGKFVEFYGAGLAHLPLADRATIANMAPEYGATCGIFPIDQETLHYLELSGRSSGHLALVEHYARQQGLWRQDSGPPARYSDAMSLDMGSVEPSLAGPRRPQDRISLKKAQQIYRKELQVMCRERKGSGSAPMKLGAGESCELRDGAVVIAAITSCTNTSNPSVMVGAGLLAQKAAARGMQVKPWVKTSLAPGSLVVRNYLDKAGLLSALETLGFHIVGFGCTTCIGNSGPLPEPVSQAIAAGDVVAASVLSGNRNFEGRVHPEVRMNFLASPPLVVAYALTGTMDVDLYQEPLGQDQDGRPVYLRELWPEQKEIAAVMQSSLNSSMFRNSYQDVFAGDKHWNALQIPKGNRYLWQQESTYVRLPPFFQDIQSKPEALVPVRGARLLALLGDSITTDHISPAGSIAKSSPAGRYLIEHQVDPADFNSYGSRRGNHEVMMRGTFANVRLRNQLAPGTEGGWTRHFPSAEQMSIYDAAMRYQQEKVPLLVIAGKEYGTGSSRDWAAKGTRLLGVRAVLAQSFERIHRSNLVGMGVLPLLLPPGESAESLGIRGQEQFDLEDIQPGARELKVTVRPEDGTRVEFQTKVCIDTPKEWDYFLNGGILPYVLRQLAA